MRRLALRFAVGSALLAAIASMATAQIGETLRQARTGHGPDIVVALRQKATPHRPPASSNLKLVTYPAAPGDMFGYLTKDPGDGKKHPAIIWISGGDTAIGDFWSPQPKENDQSGAAFREAGLVVFYPSVRGLNGNPGQIEGYYGELDDIVAATAWLKQQRWVDPSRVYLGGHSSGGTMVLLAAEYAGDWKAVFAFGAVHDPRGYGAGLWGALPFDPANQDASRLRAPVNWLSSITVPTFLIEGGRQGNIGPLQTMRQANQNPLVQFTIGQGCTHFSILRPASEKIADAIVYDRVDAMFGSGGFPISCE
jgi:dipeptidyl aminopeptidase/acylaminoacyl peptidase